MTAQQQRVMRDILACRTEALGGHLDVCLACGDETPSYNSCRNRHCPKCQSLTQARWIAARKARILSVPHFHTVFTVPSTLRPLANHNRKLFFTLLFRAAASTLLTFGDDPHWLGAQLGITAVLHTWSRELCFHPHLHCIVTAGGLANDQSRWVAPRRPTFLFPVRALATVFRTRLLEGLSAAHRDGLLQFDGTCAALGDPANFARLVGRLGAKRWHVYAKPPFGGPDHLMEYLGRYTHRVGISNQRLLHHDPRAVRFLTKDGNTLTLPPHEFIRRFLMHVLPAGFVKIRHYGLLAAGNATTRLQTAAALIESATPTPIGPAPEPPLPHTATWQDLLQTLTGTDIRVCPHCGQLTRVQQRLQQPRPPPEPRPTPS